MYWYPFSEEEEEQAWKQAEAQAEAYGGGEEKGAMKFIGNLGELAVFELLDSFLEHPSHQWEYANKEALENAEPESNDYDFSIHTVNIDVKATSDVRKFSPVAMFDAPSSRDIGPGREGYPVVDVTSDADVFIFVLIRRPETEHPQYNDEGELSKIQQKRLEEQSGNHVAVILGWMYDKEFTGEMMGQFNQVSGKPTRMNLRNVYELFLRSGASI